MLFVGFSAVLWVVSLAMGFEMRRTTGYKRVLYVLWTFWLSFIKEMKVSC